MPGFNSKRLTEMRIVRDVAQGQLADGLGVTKQMISKYERGKSIPSLDTIWNIVGLLNVPKKHLYKESPLLTADSSPLFLRAPTSTKKNFREYARIVSQWGYEILCSIKDPPQPYLLFSINEKLPIPEKAMELRRQWGLGAHPIENLTTLLESRGFSIFTIDSPDFRTEAFSQIINGVPITVLNKGFGTAVRQRFSLAHELGHMVLHKNLFSCESELIDADIEREADLFAEYFLMPINGFEYSFTSPKMDRFIHMKKEWKVSIASIIIHCEHIGLIDMEKKDALQRKMNIKGWKKFEPLDDEIMPEIPTKIATLVSEQVVDLNTFNNFFDKVQLPVDMIEHICSMPNGTLTRFCNDITKGHAVKQLSLFDVGGCSHA